MEYSPDWNLDYYVKVDLKDVKPRTCLCCQKEFKSKHKFNRVCGNCKETVLRVIPFKETVGTSGFNFKTY